MRWTTFLLPISLTILACPDLWAQAPRVKGAELIKADADPEEVLPAIISLPITQEEVDLGLAALGRIAQWLKEHPEIVTNVGEGGSFATLLAADVWKDAGITGPEFLAITGKLRWAKELTDGAEPMMEILDSQIKTFTEVTAREYDPVQREKDLKKLNLMKKMKDAVRQYPRTNIELYKKNKERIERAMAIFSDVGPARDREPKQEDPADPDKAIREHPNDPEGYYNRGLARTETGDFKGAIGDFSRAIELDPTHVNACIERGSLKYTIKDYRGAIDDWKKAIEIDPSRKQQLQKPMDDAIQKLKSAK